MIHDAFYISLLEQDITRKKRVNETLLEPEIKFETSDKKEYEIEAIINSAMYGQKADD